MPGPYDHIEQIPVDETTRPDPQVVDIARHRVNRMKRQAERDAKKREQQQRRSIDDDNGPEAA